MRCIHGDSLRQKIKNISSVVHLRQYCAPPPVTESCEIYIQSDHDFSCLGFTFEFFNYTQIILKMQEIILKICRTAVTGCYFKSSFPSSAWQGENPSCGGRQGFKPQRLKEPLRFYTQSLGRSDDSASLLSGTAAGFATVQAFVAGTVANHNAAAKGAWRRVGLSHKDGFFVLYCLAL